MNETKVELMKTEIQRPPSAAGNRAPKRPAKPKENLPALIERFDLGAEARNMPLPDVVGVGRGGSSSPDMA
jgi:hypothetical protein